MKKKRHQRKVGMLPGTLVHTGKQKMDVTDLTHIEYNEESQLKKTYRNITEIKINTNEQKVGWYNLDGLHDVDQVKKIGDYFSLHHLLLEDILSLEQRPKTEIYDNCIFISLKMFNLTSNKTIDVEQLSIVLRENTVISFQEKQGDVFNGIRTSIVENQGRVRKKNADYLMYRMLDVIVDNYYIILDYFEERIQSLEDQVDANEVNDWDRSIRNQKKELIQFRKDIRPLNDAIQRLLKDDLELIEPSTKTYLNDVHDHLSQIIDDLDTQRENLTVLTEQYHTQQGMKLNKVMKLLTIISTIFIPLTFIVGVYGMNFKNMPELSWENGYYLTWGLMFTITLVLVILFRVKKWW